MIVINLWGAPSSGKSTGASYLFSELKLKGYNVELVTEFAKDLTWEEKSRVIAEYDFDGRNISRYTHNNCSYYGSNRDKDYFLQLVKEREPEVYDKIMKGRAYNG